jgi:hypothetical protein
LGLGQFGASSRSCLLDGGAPVSLVLEPHFNAFSRGTFPFDVKAVL